MKTYTRYPMDSLKNCRDLGGIPTADGGVTRFGVLVRSELPRALTEHDTELFREIGVMTSIDLRSTRETALNPSAMRDLGFVEYLHMPLINEAAELGADVKRPEPPTDMGDINWGEEYISMIETSGDWIQRVLTVVAEAKGAVQYNCTTGKDRTGLFSMLMLSVAGCSDEDIISNYSVSDIHMRSVYFTMAHMFPGGVVREEDLDHGFFSTAAANMRTVLEYLRDTYGGVVPFLTSRGISAELLDAVHSKLVEY